MRVSHQYKHYVFGTYDDLIRFGLLLESRKWDTSTLKKCIVSLVSGGKIQKTRYTGQLDGYQMKDENGKVINDADKFYADLDSSIKNDSFKFYPKQKQGIAWLYSRNSAIIGDKTGAGKTSSLLGAAFMRMKQSGGRTLVITLPSTQQQWIDEIGYLFGEEERNLVSTNPASNAKWIILNYQDFSSTQKKGQDKQPLFSPEGIPLVKREKVQQVLNALMSNPCQIVILDEAHMLKNNSAAKSKNIAGVTAKSEFKWAGSATPVANKPDDIHNVLRMIGHNLGKINDAMFIREFVGAQMKIKQMRGTPEERAAIKKIQEDAAMRLRKWLTLSGAYISRSKKAMNPSIPDHTVSDVDIQEDEFDSKKYWEDFSDRMEKYKNPELAISQMIGQRITLATNKVPTSLEQANSVLNQKDENGNPLKKKVLLFSCFQESSENLVSGLKNILSKTDPQARVVHIIGKDKRSDVVKAISDFRQDKNARAMVISSLKGGTGVNLPNTTQDVIINDFDWTPKITEQTEGRAYRINNVIPVHTKYMIAKGTPDEVFYKYVRAKIDLSNLIQDMDSEMEEKILVGIDDKDLKAKIQAAKDRLDMAEVYLVQDLKTMMDSHGVASNVNMDPSEFDLDEAELGNDEDMSKKAESSEKAKSSPIGWLAVAKMSEFDDLPQSVCSHSSLQE
jgi:SNF2 family DNA or RNA helicase